MDFPAVFLIDQDEIFSKILSRHLNLAQLPHLITDSGQEVARQLRPNRPAVIVSELFVLETPIWEWIPKWRTGDHFQIPIIALTGDSTRDNLEKCLECGVNRYLVKTENSFPAIISAILDQF